MDRMSESEMVDVPIRTTSARDYGMGPRVVRSLSKALQTSHFMRADCRDWMLLPRSGNGEVGLLRRPDSQRAGVQRAMAQDPCVLRI